MPEIARVPLDARPTVAEPDDDPYLWLEDIEGPRALAWVEAESDRTLQAFGNAQFAADRDTLAAILDRPDKLPFVARRKRLTDTYLSDPAIRALPPAAPEVGSEVVDSQ